MPNPVAPAFLRSAFEPLRISNKPSIDLDYLGGGDLALQSLCCDLIIAATRARQAPLPASIR
ncbi:TPA: hypothetical protein ACGY72_001513 [Stenotrophomonas maltophilia]